MNVQRDHLWKLAFRMMMQQMVEFFFPNQYDLIDWSKEIVFLDKELNTIQADSRPKNRVADVLVMLTLKNGEKLVIFLHIEVQGYFDAHFGFRVHQMRYRIEDKTGENPVMLSIFTDDDLSFHPKEYYIETWGASSRIVFNTYKVMENPPESYKDPDNPVALIMEIVYKSTQIKKATDEDIMTSFVALVAKLISKGYSKEYVHLMKNFIEAHVKFGNSKNYRIFERKIEKMVKYETTAEILSFYDFEKRLEISQKAEKKALLNAERALKKAKREHQEKERANELAVLSMLSQNMTKDIISSILKISIDDINAICEKYKDNNPLTKLLDSRS